jgi:transcriptional regulator with XRE-family HTH domain
MYKVSSKKLKKIREAQGKTQREIADIIGKNKVDIGHYENDRATPPANALITFMVEMKVNPLDIAEKIGAKV